MDQRIIDWVAQQRKAGYTDQQIRQYLLSNDYNQDDINFLLSGKSLAEGNGLQKNYDQKNQDMKKPNANFIKYFILAMVIVAVSLFVLWFFTRSYCGDGTLDSGETSFNCCLDAGCPGKQTCEDNVCTGDICGQCEYLSDDDICIKYDCCKDSDCDDLDPSTEDKCTGSPKRCLNLEIFECREGDSYCPPICNHLNDPDCPENIELIDCGTALISNISEVNNSDNIPVLNYSESKALDCFGSAVINCSPAKVIINDSNSSIRSKMIKVVPEKDMCNVYQEFIETDERFSSFSGKNLSCSISMDKLKTLKCSKNRCLEPDLPSSFAISVPESLALDAVNNPSTKCIGTLVVR